MQPAVGPSSSQTEVFANLDDLLECSICYTPFQRPLQLSCGHSFCSNCVDRLCQHERGGADDIFGFGNFDGFGLADMGDPLFFGRVFAPPEPNRPGLGGAQEADAQRAAVDERDPWYDGGVPVIHRRLYPFRNNPRFADYRRIQNERRVPVGVPERRDIQIRCPECRRYTNVPPEGLPVNYRLQDMISRLNISKSKTVTKKDLLKCGTCDEKLQCSSFFTCKTDNCTHPDRTKLCPTCAIRNHNGHQIEEIKLLSERDIAVAKEAISLHTAHAHQSLEQIESGFTMLATKAKERLGNIVKDGMNVFANIAGGLDNEIFTSHEAVQVSVDKAKSIAEHYETLMNTMNESVAAVDTKFTELGSQLTDFFKQAGYSVPMEKVKIEPAEENDILVVDMERERQQQQQEERRRQEEVAQHQQQLHFMEIVRRQRADERERERNRAYRNDFPNGHQLMRRIRERQQNIGNNHAVRMNARLERLNRHVRDEEPEEPFHRPRTPVQPPRRERLQDFPIPQAPVVAPIQNNVRDRGAQVPPLPNVKREIVTPPGSPGRVEDQQEPVAIADDPLPRRQLRRRLADNDPNRPGPSNQAGADHGEPMLTRTEQRREVNDDPENIRNVPTEASSSKIV